MPVEGHSEEPIINKKFRRLEAKIDSNHTELMKAICKEVHPSLKTMGQAGTPVHDRGDDFGQSPHVVESDRTDPILEQLEPHSNTEVTISDPKDVDADKVSEKAHVMEDVEVDNTSKNQQLMKDVASPPPKAHNDYVPVQATISNKSSADDTSKDPQPIEDITSPPPKNDRA